VKPQSSGVRHDYKEGPAAPATTVPNRRWLLFAVGMAVPLGAAALLYIAAPAPRVKLPPAEATLGPPADALTPNPSEPAEAESAEAPPALDAATTESPPSEEPTATTLNLLVRKGDTLEQLFKRNGLSLGDLAAIVDLPKIGDALKLLQPGDRLAIAHHDGDVVSLQREIDDVRLLSVERHGGGFTANVVERQLDVRTSAAHGVVRTSLFDAGVDAGMSDKLIMAMAGVFQWDIDFVQDVREGDEFTVIYEEFWRDGVKLSNGDVVAAEFVNQGKAYRAARYRDPTGHVDYFAPDGRSMRKAFIRAPVDFTRISSNFNPNRRHPILNRIRAHQGVDYAAPIGTPVWATGDGKVIFRGVRGGYGNAIVLQHGGNVTTLYGHMSRFANVHVGNRVKQGQVIGYVGQTGLATGPHLHYEYRVNGVHRNPRTVTLPPADPVPAEYQDDFRASTAPLWRQLDLYDTAATTTTTANVAP
jgi:murein DD-endopeptidase MepM/ murein hydrolase activator NlpD